MFDLIIKGGTLIDPYLGVEEVYDVALEGGRVAALEKEIAENEGLEIFDATGCLVAPGLIDLHTHVYWGVSHYGVDADSTCLTKGVTTAIDAGSSGALNFRGFRKYVIEKSKTRILAFLHISSVGLTLPVGELLDFRNLDFNKAVEIARENSDIIIGIKIRLNDGIVGDLGPQALILAKEAAKRLGVPLMVHPGSLAQNLPMSDVLSILEKGDIVTHCFPPPYPPLQEVPSILNQKGDVIDDAWDAADRGVVFDVGHGRGSFSFDTAEKALKHGFMPTTISTDLHVYNVDHPVYDMPTTLSKFLNMGVPLRKIIEMSTNNPASVVEIKERIGTLQEGAEGDAAILKIERGEFTFWDVLGETRVGQKCIKTVAAFKKGKRVL